jgi:hypothetical protein
VPDNNVRSAQIPLGRNSLADRANTSVAQPTPDRSHDEHQAIGTEWLQCAIIGIREMHQDETQRRRVALGLF